MAASVNASTSAGVVITADTTGNLNLQSNGTTIIGYTSAGVAVTGTFSNTGQTILSSSSGNVGVGVTPNASWSGKVVQVGNLTTFAEIASNNSVIYSNLYFDGSGTKYLTTAAGSYYDQVAGQHIFATAVSGTAGNAATTVNAMTLDASSLTIAGATATKASGTTWANPSDIRVKSFSGRYTKGLPELMRLEYWTGEYNGLGGTPAGTPFVSVKAQEVQAFLPSTVSTYRAKLNPEDTDETDILRWDSSEIVPMLVNSVIAQQAMIESLTARIAALEAK
jgi:hypothetical protein